MKNILTALVFGLVVSACGGAKEPAPAAAPAAAPPPSVTAPASESAPIVPAADPTVASWSDKHEIHELMEDNGAAMKKVRKLAKEGEFAGTAEPLAKLKIGLLDLQTRSKGFVGENPAKFQELSDSAVRAAGDLEAVLASGAPTAEAIGPKLEALRATCKGCHDLYDKD